MADTATAPSRAHHRIPTDELAPPDLDRILQKRRKWYHHLVHPRLPEFPRAVQLPLTCLTICLSAVQANGVYVWPTYGPVVMRKLGLSGTEGQTIVVGGILGVYIMAAPLGSLTDRYGPRFGSFQSALLAALGYLSFAFTLQYATPETPYVHLYLTLSFFAIGAATVGSYFAALTCASLSFPSHPTLSLSVPLAILSLSSLVLSSFSSLPTFIDRSPESYGELDAVRFLVFLGIICAAVNILSSLFMRILDTPIELLDEEDRDSEDDYDEDGEPRSPVSQLLHLDERTPLLIGGPNAAREDAEAVVRGKERWTARRLVGDIGGFWVFGILLALCIGPSETIIASIGSILTSLLPPNVTMPSLSPTLSLLSPAVPTPSEALALRNKHVSILSISGTISRLLTGLIADHLAPPLTPIKVPHGPGQNDMNASMHVYVQRKPVILLRGTFNAICAILLAGVFAWSAGWLEGEEGLWVLSAGTGVMYGALFTLTPAIVSAHFGPTNFGLAWGLVSYFSAAGAVVFSYLYAFISTAIGSIPDHSGVPGAPDQIGIATKTDQPPTCYGSRCFSSTLWIASGCCLISGIGMFWVGRKWKV